MKKILLVSLFAFINMGILNAQTTFGIRTGLNNSFIEASEDKNLLAAGFDIQSRIGDYFMIHSFIGYQPKGYGITTTSIRTDAAQLNLAPAGRYMINDDMEIMLSAGGFLSYVLNVSEKYSGKAGFISGNLLNFNDTTVTYSPDIISTIDKRTWDKHKGYTYSLGRPHTPILYGWNVTAGYRWKFLQVLLAYEYNLNSIYTSKFESVVEKNATFDELVYIDDYKSTKFQYSTIMLHLNIILSGLNELD